MRQAPQSSALMRSRVGEPASWGVTDHLLAAVVDALNGANWQRSGGKGPKPKPVKRPKSKSERAALGSGAIPIHDFDAWWNEGVTH